MKISKAKRAHLVELCEMLRRSHRWGYDARGPFVQRNTWRRKAAP